MHLHFNLPYRSDEDPDMSFFSYAPDSPARFEPKDPSLHRPLTVQQVLDRRLHWVTLGGQYDWTGRVYPEGRPPDFPPDIAGFLETLFPDTVAQAAIVNFYSPGDTMMMHRDVSEETDKGLISISLGCDSLFMITPEDVGKMTEEEREARGDVKKHLLLRLRSGDAIYMTQESRFAWHGVPKILKGTCPPYLEDWPAEQGKYEAWKGWMKNKRINLNVRQMKD
jgi:DNA alkylation damage repair protein AlkB